MPADLLTMFVAPCSGDATIARIRAVRAFRREQAAGTVRHIAGVRGVLHIEVAPRTTERDVRRRIVQALHRRAGAVRSWSERDAAEDAARRAPGIRRVDNEVFVVPHERLHGADRIC